MKLTFALSILYSILAVLSGVASAEVPNYIVNAPKGQWLKLGTNEATDVAFDWNTPGYPAGAGSKFSELFGVWAGGAFDPNIPAMYFTGGGHASYDGNELYAFRFDLNKWERVNDPSPYLETQQSEGLLPDGLPMAIHTYGEIGLNPDTGKVYRFSAGGSEIKNIWEFNPNFKARPFAYSDTLQAWRDTGSRTSPGYQMTYDWDPVTKKFYGGGHPGSSSFFDSKAYNPATNTLEELPDFPPFGFAPGGEVSLTIDYDSRLMYVVGGRFNGNGSYVERGTITYNIDSQEWSDLTQQTSGDKLPERSAKAGLSYDSNRKILWWWHGVPSPQTLFTFNPRTKVWSTIDPSGPVPASSYSQGTFNKFRYIPKYDVLVALGGDTSRPPEMWMFKPSDWIRPDSALLNPPKNLRLRD